MLAYPIQATPDDNGTFLITSPPLPEVTTFAESAEEAERVALAAIEEALGARIAHGREIPHPRAGAFADMPTIELPALTTVKVALYEWMRQSGITRADLQRRLGWHREQIDRLFRLDHASRLDQLEAALEAIGLRMSVTVNPAPSADSRPHVA